MIKLSDLKKHPDNPRTISKKGLKKLVKSLSKNEFMMKEKPLRVDFENGGVIWAGNQRYEALLQLGFKEIPDEWVKDISYLTLKQKKTFMVLDNINNGQFEMEAFETDYWVDEEFEEYLPEEEGQKTDKEPKPEKKVWVPDCLFPSNNMYDIPTLLIEQQGDKVINPVVPFGYEKRGMKGVGTYHFYVDDYRFQKIWEKPEQVIDSGCYAIVEPNISTFDTTPISYGLHLIYKKRWIARFLQDFGIKVFADLNVSVKFAEYNTFGIPEGYNAFATRGYAQRPEMVISELEIAKKISKLETPNMVVYGGGKKVKEICAENNLLYIESKITSKFKGDE